jgi:hypothetical protein
MTLIELLFFLGMIAGGVFLFWVANIEYGLGVAFIAFPIGFLIVRLFYFILRQIFELWYTIFPLRPNCQKGTCTSDQYEIFIVDDDSFLCICKCGDKYLRVGSFFYKITPSGERQPYMKRKGLSWVVDDNTAYQKET